MKPVMDSALNVTINFYKNSLIKVNPVESICWDNSLGRTCAFWQQLWGPGMPRRE